MLQGDMREEVARILETVAQDGLPRRDLDVALDAIGCVLEGEGVGAVVTAARQLIAATEPGGMGSIRLPDRDGTRNRLGRLKHALEQLDGPAEVIVLKGNACGKSTDMPPIISDAGGGP